MMFSSNSKCSMLASVAGHWCFVRVGLLCHPSLRPVAPAGINFLTSAESQNREEMQAQPGSIRQSEPHMVHRSPLDLTHNLITAHRSCSRTLGRLTDIKDKSLSLICKSSPIRSRQIRYINAKT